jgi:hypothetical protein
LTRFEESKSLHVWQETRHNYTSDKEDTIVKIALSIICISIFCVSFRGIIGYGRMIETDKPDHKEIKKNLYIVGGIIAILALLLLVLINIYGF